MIVPIIFGIGLFYHTYFCEVGPDIHICKV
jgi:hypothetical protein